MIKFDKSKLATQITLEDEKFIRLLFWNIHGQNSGIVGNKFVECEFLETCRSSDILGIAELHTESTPDIKGFKLIKQKIREKKHRGPKISGGIAVFAKNSISHMVKPINNNHEDSIWIKLSKNETGEANDIFIGTAYISPGKSAASNNSLDVFFEEAQMFSKRGLVLLQGDLNARTGSSADYICKDKIDKEFCIVNYDKPLSRNSEDKSTCLRGANLLDACKSLDLLIVNGRKCGDIFGKYTSIQWNGSSVVDYVILPNKFFDKILSMEVGNFLPWLSDHCPLIYTIELDKDKCKQETHETDLNQLPPRFMWNIENKNKFETELQSEPVRKTFESIQNNKNRKAPDDCVSQITEVLMDCAYKSGLKKNVKPKNVPNNSPWFDQECRNMKKLFREKQEN